VEREGQISRLNSYGRAELGTLLDDERGSMRERQSWRASREVIEQDPMCNVALGRLLSSGRNQVIPIRTCAHKGPQETAAKV
jgi:hypothetical protein